MCVYVYTCVYIYIYIYICIYIAGVPGDAGALRAVIGGDQRAVWQRAVWQRAGSNVV